MGLDAMIFVFWILNFKPVFPFSSFTFISRLFSSSLLSAIRVVSSAYLRLLIFLPETLIPTCASSSLAFHVMYPACKLNKQGDTIQPWCTPFPISNQCVCVCVCVCVEREREKNEKKWVYTYCYSKILQEMQTRNYGRNTYIKEKATQIQY